MSKNAETVEKAVIYLEKTIERDLGMQVKTTYLTPTEVHMTFSLDDRSIRISDNVEKGMHDYNLILGMKNMEKVETPSKNCYFFPMRLIDVVIAKISYDNKVRRGEVSADR